MPRLFTAIDLPDAVIDQLTSLQVAIPGVQWRDDDDLHITLRFAGDIDAATAREFRANLREISADAFSLRLEGLETFGGAEPHTLYAAIALTPELIALARANERAARNAGLPSRQQRAFRPHVTLARLRHANPEHLARYLGRRGAFRSSPFFVSAFHLLESRAGVGGGPYLLDEIVPLLGGDYADMSDDDITADI